MCIVCLLLKPWHDRVRREGNDVTANKRIAMAILYKVRWLQRKKYHVRKKRPSDLCFNTYEIKERMITILKAYR